MPLLPRDERARDCLAIFVFALVFVGIIPPFQNAPFVDDWVYAWSVENLLTHGRVEVLNYSDNVNVAQIVWGAWPVCRSASRSPRCACRPGCWRLWHSAACICCCGNSMCQGETRCWEPRRSPSIRSSRCSASPS